MFPGVSGTNAIAFKFSEGVIAAVDTAATYGSLSMKDTQKVYQLSEDSLIVFTGLISDIQYLVSLVKEEIEREEHDRMDAQGIHRLLQRVLYEKRSKGELYWVSAIVVGVNNKDSTVLFSENCSAYNESKGITVGSLSANNQGGIDSSTFFNNDGVENRFLGVLNSKGNFWFDDSAALSLSSHFALPILREVDLLSLGRKEAISLMEECFKVVCYNDKRASNKIQMGIVTKKGVEIFEPRCIKTEWAIGHNEKEILL